MTKIIIAVIASVLVVAAVVAVVINTTKRDSSNAGADADHVTTTNKAVDTVCTPTQYKDICKNSLSESNSTDPKTLIETAINVAVKSVGDAMKNSTLLQRAAKDPMTKGAFEVCEDVLQQAADELKRAVDKIEEVNVARIKEYIADLRTWLSAVLTNQETCTDAFQNTTGDTGEKMKQLLVTAKELSSNGLAMVTAISEFVGKLDLESIAGGRQLVSREIEEFVRRRLLPAPTVSLKPTIEVAQDGSGQFKTIGAAIASLPKLNNKTYIVIHIKAGLYKEQVTVPKGLNKVMFVGDGQTKTRISGGLSFAGGVQTYYTASLIIGGEDFLGKDFGVENTAGSDGHQAVAVRVSGDRSIMHNVAMEGYQDTLCADTHRQFYQNCTISGTIDYIFGNGLSLFQDCTFITRKPGPKQGCMVTAQGRKDPKSNTAYIIQNGHFTAEPALLATVPPVPVYLGRPWKELSRTIIMQSNIEGVIAPAGWSPWIGTIGLDTCHYAEFQNRGPGSNVAGRVTWKGIQKITAAAAKKWTGEVVFGGDAWIRESGVPYTPGMMRV